jgi:hypothetical protein
MFDSLYAPIANAGDPPPATSGNFSKRKVL